MSEDCDCLDGGHDDGRGSCLCGGQLHTELADLRRRLDRIAELTGVYDPGDPNAAEIRRLAER